MTTVTFNEIKQALDEGDAEYPNTWDRKKESIENKSIVLSFAGGPGEILYSLKLAAPFINKFKPSQVLVIAEHRFLAMLKREMIKHQCEINFMSGHEAEINLDEYDVVVHSILHGFDSFAEIRNATRTNVQPVKVEQDRIEFWMKRIKQKAPKALMIIGVSYTTIREGGQARTIDLDQFKQFENEDIVVVDLQYQAFGIERLTMSNLVSFDDLDTFCSVEDTLALVNCCDVIIGNDSSIVYFAGAAMRPTYCITEFGFYNYSSMLMKIGMPNINFIESLWFQSVYLLVYKNKDELTEIFKGMRVAITKIIVTKKVAKYKQENRCM